MTRTGCDIYIYIYIYFERERERETGNSTLPARLDDYNDNESKVLQYFSTYLFVVCISRD